MTLYHRRLHAATKAFKKATAKEYSNIKAGKWIIDDSTEMGHPVQYWWRKCHWHCLGKMNGVFSVCFEGNSSKPIPVT